ncbi:MAG: hypothetical protein EA384_09075 [Spirochaetaceae bacterium]|nr:MAG: hypothetical protein EA384_09075 [Spirochaetaceae bacterium]
MNRLFRLRVSMAALITAATLILAACGELSVYLLLESEEVGPFSMSQASVNLTVDSQHLVSARGGYREYRYELLADSWGEFDPDTRVYTASGPIPSDEETAIVAATDHFGATDLTTIYVYNRLTVLPSSFAVEVSDQTVSVDLTLVGGFGSRTVQATELGNPAWITGDVDDETLHYTPTVAGEDQIEIGDQKGNSVIVRITVHDTSKLFIDPTSATAVPGGDAVTFTVGGGSGDLSIEPDQAYASMFNWDGVSVLTFTPGDQIETPAEIRIVVSDAVAQAHATVYVVSQHPEPVTINPGVVELRTGGSVQLRAAGGVPPYRFEIASGHGSLQQRDFRTVLYSAPDRQGVTRVRVTDSLGQTAVAQIKIIR